MKTSTLQDSSASPGFDVLSDVQPHPLRTWLLKQITNLAVIAVLGTACYLLISKFVFQMVIVDGNSMNPTLMSNSYYWLFRSAYLRHAPQRTDIVAAKDPEDGGLVVKRIIALPGESIYLDHGKVYIDGQLLKESYLPDKLPTYAYDKNESEFFIVGRDAYFVMGDNRNNSCDSRTFGTVPRKNILGKVAY
jgi:signal peptidase I